MRLLQMEFDRRDRIVGAHRRRPHRIHARVPALAVDEHATPTGSEQLLASSADHLRKMDSLSVRSATCELLDGKPCLFQMQFERRQRVA